MKKIILRILITLVILALLGWLLYPTVADQLARPVEGRHAAAIGPEDRAAPAGELLLRHVQMGGFAAPAHGHDGFVLKDQEGVGSLARDDGLLPGLLEVQGLLVADKAEAEHFEGEAFSEAGVRCHGVVPLLKIHGSRPPCQGRTDGFQSRYERKG